MRMRETIFANRAWGCPPSLTPPLPMDHGQSESSTGPFHEGVEGLDVLGSSRRQFSVSYLVGGFERFPRQKHPETNPRRPHAPPTGGRGFWTFWTAHQPLPRGVHGLWILKISDPLQRGGRQEGVQSDLRTARHRSLLIIERGVYAAGIKWCVDKKV